MLSASSAVASRCGCHGHLRLAGDDDEGLPPSATASKPPAMLLDRSVNTLLRPPPLLDHVREPVRCVEREKLLRLLSLRSLMGSSVIDGSGNVDCASDEASRETGVDGNIAMRPPNIVCRKARPRAAAWSFLAAACCSSVAFESSAINALDLRVGSRTERPHWQQQTIAEAIDCAAASSGRNKKLRTSVAL